MKKIRFLTGLLLSAALLLALCVPVFAAETHRSEPLGGDLTQNDDQVWLSDSMYYDLLSHDFAYPVGETGLTAHANVADGMIVRGPVNITGNALVAYRNGSAYEGALTGMETPGDYLIKSQVGNEMLQLFSFTIVGPTTADLYAYAVPNGMYITNATRSGEAIAFDRHEVSMQADGDYHIYYECIETGIAYVLEVTVDRQPPELEFSGSIDENNRVHSALHVAGIEEGGSIRINLDGVDIDVVPNADGSLDLPDSGRYYIEVYDAAGNRTEYSYTVLIYLNSSSLVFFILLFVSIAAVVVYIIIKRKKLKIG